MSSEHEHADELPDDVDARFGELEVEIERIDALRHAYDPNEIARAGVFVVLSPDGEARIERGFIRAEDEKPEPDEAEAEDGRVIDGVHVNGDGEVIEDGDHAAAHDAEDEDAEDDGKPLSELLVRDLTAHRTLGLRLALYDHGIDGIRVQPRNFIETIDDKCFLLGAKRLIPEPAGAERLYVQRPGEVREQFRLPGTWFCENKDDRTKLQKRGLAYPTFSVQLSKVMVSNHPCVYWSTLVRC